MLRLTVKLINEVVNVKWMKKLSTIILLHQTFLQRNIKHAATFESL